MISKDKFMQQFNGHSNWYSSYIVIDADIDNLIKVLNDINPDMCIGSGVINDNSIYFEICKNLPEMLCEITEKLNCKGFAHIASWLGEGYFVAYKNGSIYDDYTAEWAEGKPERRDWDYEAPPEADEDIMWDAFVKVTDIETGVKFDTGEGAVDYNAMTQWKELVESH